MIYPLYSGLQLLGQLPIPRSLLFPFGYVPFVKRWKGKVYLLRCIAELIEFTCVLKISKGRVRRVEFLPNLGKVAFGE